MNVFDNVSIETSIIQITKKEKSNKNILVNNSYFINQKKDLSKEGFYFLNLEIFNLKEKILNQGELLKNFKTINIRYGIKTGFNKAFIIDKNLKNELIKKDPKNEEIIKPVLKGRNLKKYKRDFEKDYLIFTRQGININQYPSIKEYLYQFKKDLTPKKKGQKGGKGRVHGSYKWYEIQTNATYYEEFENPKLVYPRISSEMFTIYDTGKNYCIDTVFMINCNDEQQLKVLQALLDSKVLNFIYRIIGVAYNKSIELRKTYVGNLPIKFPENNELNNKIINLLIQLENNIKELSKLPKKSQDIKIKEINAIENELNSIIYDLYDLDEDDIKIIENYLENIGNEK